MGDRKTSFLVLYNSTKFWSGSMDTRTGQVKLNRAVAGVDVGDLRNSVVLKISIPIKSKPSREKVTESGRSFKEMADLPNDEPSGILASLFLSGKPWNTSL